jgi:hypothetical protein
LTGKEWLSVTPYFKRPALKSELETDENRKMVIDALDGIKKSITKKYY